MTATTAQIPVSTRDRWWTTAMVCNWSPPQGQPVPYWVCPARLQSVGLADNAAGAITGMRARAARDGWSTDHAGRDLCPAHPEETP